MGGVALTNSDLAAITPLAFPGLRKVVFGRDTLPKSSLRYLPGNPTLKHLGTWHDRECRHITEERFPALQSILLLGSALSELPEHSSVQTLLLNKISSTDSWRLLTRDRFASLEKVVVKKRSR